MRLPAGSNANTGGVFSAPGWLLGRCVTHTLSCESTPMPTTFPNIQLFGSSFGQNGSTWYDAGAGACAATCEIVPPVEATMTATSDAREIIGVRGLCRRSIHCLRLVVADSKSRSHWRQGLVR